MTIDTERRPPSPRGHDVAPPTSALRNGQCDAAIIWRCDTWGSRGPPEPQKAPKGAQPPPPTHTPAQVGGVGKPPHGLGVCVWMPPVNGTGNGPSPGRPTPGVVKQDKSSRGSVDTTKTRSDPQRVRMSSGERPIGTAKGTQSDTEAFCQAPPPPACANPLSPAPYLRHWRFCRIGPNTQFTVRHNGLCH